MATGKSLDELNALIQAARKARRREGRARPRELVPTVHSQSERFTDLFRPPTEYGPPTDEDRALFRAATVDVVPLKVSARADVRAPRPPARPLKREADEAAALAQSRLAVEPSPMSWDLGLDIEDEQSFLRAGTNPDLLRKLRRGYWAIDAEIDLHNHTQDEAYAALTRFLRAARAAGWRCVRIIHGKGLTSFQRQPVLRGKVRRWLTRFADVTAYCEPRPNAGGSGAVLVLLNVG
ncbi:MAG: Smr/MutS family protein [Casimicrobiaceae bacterium]